MRPIIAIPWPKADYLEALSRAGAEPRELRPDRDLLPAALETCDGVLLTGGVDVDPALYGEPERHPSVEIDPARDAYELAVARLALARDMPMLAICRGAQVLNVAAGGTLIQDILDEIPSALDHRFEPRTGAAHPIEVDPDSRLADVLGATRVLVNSLHHQSVRDSASGLVVVAHAPDGVVEGIECPGHRFAVAVQFHPEELVPGHAASERLFARFIQAARR